MGRGSDQEDCSSCFLRSDLDPMGPRLRLLRGYREYWIPLYRETYPRFVRGISTDPFRPTIFIIRILLYEPIFRDVAF